MILCMFFAIFAILFGLFLIAERFASDIETTNMSVWFGLAFLAGGITYILHHFNLC